MSGGEGIEIVEVDDPSLVGEDFFFWHVRHLQYILLGQKEFGSYFTVSSSPRPNFLFASIRTTV